uniref:Uncharacterized protein n=1 Tax=Timema bartmani TaxID=61472 RepID=A0A7R9I5L3_9NEOP|nr:unnamed protein product [Timema bartmani]
MLRKLCYTIHNGNYKASYRNTQHPQKMSQIHHEISLRHMCGDRMVVSEKHDAGLKRDCEDLGSLLAASNIAGYPGHLLQSTVILVARIEYYSNITCCRTVRTWDCEDLGSLLAASNIAGYPGHLLQSTVILVARIEYYSNITCCRTVRTWDCEDLGSLLAASNIAGYPGHLLQSTVILVARIEYYSNITCCRTVRTWDCEDLGSLLAASNIAGYPGHLLQSTVILVARIEYYSNITCCRTVRTWDCEDLGSLLAASNIAGYPGHLLQSIVILVGRSVNGNLSTLLESPEMQREARLLALRHSAQLLLDSEEGSRALLHHDWADPQWCSYSWLTWLPWLQCSQGERQQGGISSVQLEPMSAFCS